MSEKSFLLVSLEEEKAKKLAQVLSNDTARRILDVLSKKDHATETELSKELKLPLSTVHYNMQHLVKADLVKDESYTYSEKGKEVIHYSLSNKYVIIAPKKTQLLKNKLKEFLPVILLSAVTTFTLKYFFTKGPALMKQRAVMEELAVAAMDAQPAIASQQDFAVWFLIGSVSALLLYFVWTEIILKKFKS